MTRTEGERLLTLFLDMGEMMIASGAEIHRTEDTLARMSRAYGAEDVSVLVITASIVITATFSEPLTQMRRIVYSGGTDYARLTALNQLSRTCCASPLNADDLAQMLEKIRSQKPQNVLIFYLGGFLAAGASAVFFGGTFLDGVFSALFALPLCLLLRLLSPRSPNRMFFNLLTSFLIGLAIRGLVLLLPFLDGDMIMIGDIMLLIPGIAMTNAVRDMFAGDTISGVMRLVECLLWAMAIAGGFMLAIFITGGF